MRSHAPAKADDTQKSRTSQPASGQARAEAFFIDNRPQAAVQRQLKELSSTSPRATQLKAQLDMVNQSPRVLQQKTATEMVRTGQGLPMRRSLAGLAEQHGIQLQAGGGETSFHKAALQGTSGGASPLPYLDTIQKSFGLHNVSSISPRTPTTARRAAAGLWAPRPSPMGQDVAFAGASPDPAHRGPRGGARRPAARRLSLLSADRRGRRPPTSGTPTRGGSRGPGKVGRGVSRPVRRSARRRADHRTHPVQGRQGPHDQIGSGCPWVFKKIGHALVGYDPHLSGASGK